ncbi:MAG: tetratricopeptide repeat protein, partial [Gammaproteobacteria bacterium]
VRSIDKDNKNLQAQSEELRVHNENLQAQNKNIRSQLTAISQKQQESDQRLRELFGQLEELQSTSVRNNADLSQIQTQALQLFANQSQLSLTVQILAEYADLSQIQTQAIQLFANQSQLSLTVQILTEQLVATHERLAVVHGQLSRVQDEMAKINEFAPVPEEKDLYTMAVGAYQRSNDVIAIEQFKRMLHYYPTGQFNANARYWMSLSLLRQEEYQEAVTVLAQILSLHSDSDLVPDSLLAMANALHLLGDEEQRRNILQKLIDDYPTTLAADKARQLGE